MAQMRCPNCGYAADDAKFSVSGGTSDTSDPSAPGVLRTPTGNVSSTAAGMRSEQIGVRGGSPRGALSNTGQRTIGLAQRMPVQNPWDILISRGEGGIATVRHRHGATPIGTVKRTASGWQATLADGPEMAPRTHQRAALGDLIGNWNRTAMRPDRPAQPPVAAAQRPEQTELMRQFGIPAVTTLATSSNGGSDGPRMTSSGSSDPDSGSDGGSGPGGLNPKGLAIYKKLIKRGMPAARALQFARNSQNSRFGQKAAS